MRKGYHIIYKRGLRLPPNGATPTQTLRLFRSIRGVATVFVAEINIDEDADRRLLSETWRDLRGKYFQYKKQSMLF
jgi:hypothetical protein